MAETKQSGTRQLQPFFLKSYSSVSYLPVPKAQRLNLNQPADTSSTYPPFCLFSMLKKVTKHPRKNLQKPSRKRPVPSKPDFMCVASQYRVGDHLGSGASGELNCLSFD